MIDILAMIILVAMSLIGFVAIFFTSFGTLLILIGIILFAAMTAFQVVTIKALIIIVLLYFIGEILEYLCVILGAKKLGASNAAVAGALVGAIPGAVIGSMFFGVGIVLGTFLGIFFGAFLVELIIKRDLVKSLKAGTGGILGRLGSVLGKILIALSMFWITAMSIMGR